MKVVMAAAISGTRDGVEWPPFGGTIDLPELEAREMVRVGLARFPAEVEAADAPADVETATIKTSPKKRGLTKADMP